MILRTEADVLAARYRSVNSKYGKALVFHMGIDAGFFAEFKYLVHAVIYCLEHQTRLLLYSKDANFGWENGWSDYFVPFCEEVCEAYHSRCNVHSLQGLRELKRLNPNVSSVDLMKWKAKTFVNNKLCRLKNNIAYGHDVLSTSDIPPYNVKEHISIPQLDIEGGYLEVFRAVASMLWRFNDETQEAVDGYVSKLGLPEHYAATQIRGGDKVTEIQLYKPSLFVETLIRNTALRNVLLLTDDYSILEAVRQDYPQFRWHSLCSPAEKGYYNSSFAKSAAETKRGQMQRFLAQVDAMARADFFTGSISVGPSLFLLEMLYPCGYPVDCSKDNLNRAAQLSIPQRNEMAKEYFRRIAGKKQTE